MRIFLDTVDLNAVRKFSAYGLVDGVTTNPSLLSRINLENRDKFLLDLCSIVDGPVSIEVISTHYDDMLKEGIKISKLSNNAVVKLPLNTEGLLACRRLSANGIKVNLTLCFSVGQAILAAKCGASFVSPFIGRLDDLTHDGLNLIRDICDIYNRYSFNTKVLAASIRTPLQIVKVAKMGADIVTIPPAILEQMMNHPMTDKGLTAFLTDWNQN